MANQDPQYASKACTRIWRKDGHDKVREMLSEKEAQVRPGANAARGNRVHPPGAGPHQALHTPRHLTAVFRRGETCPEAGSKRVIHSDKAGALPLATGFPLETVQVRGRTQADPYTQRKCDGAPRRRVGKGWSWELGHTRPTGCRGQARAESTADTEAEAREMASLPGRWMTPSQATPPRSGGPAGKGCSPPRRGARPIL